MPANNRELARKWIYLSLPLLTPLVSTFSRRTCGDGLLCRRGIQNLTRDWLCAILISVPPAVREPIAEKHHEKGFYQLQP
jgi:hypothetical protein